ncbi:MAG TPA: acyltransferase [candidate division Zixibacteria bacterium]|nr:acyltransferase [candidate division Zixibacteria bacterium]
MLGFLLNMLGKIRRRINIYRKKRWWENLRKHGMEIGKGVNLPFSTAIDVSHCFLISIGDNCGFGDECMILAHDAMPNEYLDATRIGRVKIHESCHIGARTLILPGVEIGPRSIVGANSVVAKDIPPDSVAAGNPARVICSMEEYLNKLKASMQKEPLFPYKEYDIKYITKSKKREMIEKLDKTNGFMVGGYTAMTEDGEALVRTE